MELAEPVEPEVTVYESGKPGRPGRPVRAKMLVDPAGRHVLSPEGFPLLVGEDFDMNRAIAFGRSLRNLPLPEKYARMALAFQAGGPLDLQRSYGGTSGEFVKAFRPAASYLLGMVGRAADRIARGATIRLGAAAGVFFRPAAAAAGPPACNVVWPICAGNWSDHPRSSLRRLSS
jgi:hypothetical protein